MCGKSTYIWSTFMMNIAKQIQIYKTITIFTWFLNHPGIAKKTGRVFVPRYGEQHLHGSTTSGIETFHRQLFYPWCNKRWEKMA